MQLLLYQKEQGASTSRAGKKKEQGASTSRAGKKKEQGIPPLQSTAWVLAINNVLIVGRGCYKCQISLGTAEILIGAGSGSILPCFVLFQTTIFW
jgi:hypothetical protein